MGDLEATTDIIRRWFRTSPDDFLEKTYNTNENGLEIKTRLYDLAKASPPDYFTVTAFMMRNAPEGGSYEEYYEPYFQNLEKSLDIEDSILEMTEDDFGFGIHTNVDTVRPEVYRAVLQRFGRQG